MASKRVIMFFIPQLGTGGSERLVLDIATRIDKKLFQPIILTLKIESTLPSQIENRDIKVITIDKKRRGVDLGLMLQVHRVMQEYDVAVVNTHHTFIKAQFPDATSRTVIGTAAT